MKSACHVQFPEREKTPTTELNIFLPKKFWTENNKLRMAGVGATCMAQNIHRTAVILEFVEIVL